MKINFKNKLFGYWASIVVWVIVALTAILYGTFYANTPYISWWGLAMLIADSVAGVILFITDKMKFFPICSVALTTIAILGFAIGIHSYVANAIIGIDGDGINASFIVSTILFLLADVVAIITLCMKQEDDKLNS